MSTTPLLSAPQRQHRPGVAPMIRGAGLGALVGLAMGALVALVFFVLLGADGTSTWDLESVGGRVATVAFAAVVGGVYGAIVGFVAGFGGVIAPERGLRRRIAVTALSVGMGIATLAVLAVWSGALDAAAIGVVYIVLMGVAAWIVSPFVDGEGPRAG